jgi:hypothetical protein
MLALRPYRSSHNYSEAAFSYTQASLTPPAVPSARRITTLSDHLETVAAVQFPQAAHGERHARSFNDLTSRTVYIGRTHAG